MLCNVRISNFHPFHKLWDAQQNSVLKEILDDSIDICKEGFDFSIEAVATSRFSCELVQFELSGPDGYFHRMSERQRPYMLFGNRGRLPIKVGRANIDELPVGIYTLRAFASNGVDTTEAVLTLNVEFCDAPTTPNVPNVPTKTPSTPAMPTMSPAPPSPSCSAQDFLGECRNTRQCKRKYGSNNAFDCDRRGGRVCLCGDGDVCGCVVN